MESKRAWLAWGAAIICFVVLMLVTAAIPQSQAYHDFADQRRLFPGIPNTLNVISNFPFLVVGVVGLMLCFRGDCNLRFFDDLRPYALVQFVTCIVIPLMAILIPPIYTHSIYWLWAAGFYLLAKVEEAEDKPIYRLACHFVSGHTLKHLCAAMVPVFLILMLTKRSIEAERQCLYQTWKLYWLRIKNNGWTAAAPMADCLYLEVNMEEPP
ncbi:unnamed protein product [Victoria cruziana]